MRAAQWIPVMILVGGCATEQEEMQPVEAAEERTVEEPAVVELGMEYEITRGSDGPFAFEVFMTDFNAGSSLEKESILLNLPEAPVQVISSTLAFDDLPFGLSGNHTYNVRSDVVAEEPVMAFEIRHSIYDVFGELMGNLSLPEVVDFPPGEREVRGRWSATSRAPYEHLTTVSYVYRARLVDGTVWEADITDIARAMLSLNLDSSVMDEEQIPRPPDPILGVE